MAISLLIIIVSLIGSAFISASETALISVNKIRMRRLAGEGNGRADAVMRVTEEHEKFFGAILFSGNVLNILITAVATSAAIALVDRNDALVVAAATTSAVVLIVVIGELTPKSLAALAAEKWSLVAARPVLALMTVSGPFVWVFAAIPRAIVHLLGGRQALVTPIVTEGELRMLIDLGEAEGTVRSTHGEMLEGVFRFGETEVRDIMTPRNEIVWVEAGTSVTQFLEVYQTTQHTRFPVYEDDPDDVVGILSIKDVLRSLSQIPGDLDRPVTALMRSPIFVPESNKLNDMFSTLQQSGHKIALVVDEFGGIAGIVTLTHLLEQIVGRTGEEGRRPEERFVTLGEDTFDLEGGMSIDEANDRLELGLPEGEYNTVAGFILVQLQHIPRNRERLRYGDLRFQVSEVEGNKIVRVTVRRRLPTSEQVQV